MNSQLIRIKYYLEVEASSSENMYLGFRVFQLTAVSC